VFTISNRAHEDMETFKGPQ